MSASVSACCAASTVMVSSTGRPSLIRIFMHLGPRASTLLKYSKWALTAGKLRCVMTNGIELIGVLRGRLSNNSGLTFSPNERIPSTLHTASLYHLLTCAKLRVALNVSFGNISAVHTSGSSSWIALRIDDSPHRNDASIGDTSASSLVRSRALVSMAACARRKCGASHHSWCFWLVRGLDFLSRIMFS